MKFSLDVPVIVRRPYTIINWRKRLICECHSPSRLSGWFPRRRRLMLPATTTPSLRSTTTTTAVYSRRLRRHWSFQRLRNLSRSFRNNLLVCPVSYMHTHTQTPSHTFIEPKLVGCQKGSGSDKTGHLRHANRSDRQNQRTDVRAWRYEAWRWSLWIFNTLNADIHYIQYNVFDKY